MVQDTEALHKLLLRNLPLHIIIENEVRITPFGQITVNIVLKDGVAVLGSLNIVKSRRRRYRFDKTENL